jgi:hypothetical protein
VKFIKTHVGHEDELRTKRLSQKEQTLIVEQLQAGVSNDRILENARKIRDNQLDRLNLITKRDLRNLIRRFNIDKKRDADDMVATALKVEEWNKEGEKVYILLYNELCDEDCRMMYCDECNNGCFFKFGVEVGVELSFVNALYRLRITDQLFKSYALHEWCDLNRLSNAYFDAKFKKKHPLCTYT